MTAKIKVKQFLTKTTAQARDLKEAYTNGNTGFTFSNTLAENLVFDHGNQQSIKLINNVVESGKKW